MALIDSIISYYKHEEDAANTTVDDAEENNDGTASTNTSNLSTTGKLNNAFNFVGSNSEYYSVGTMGSFGSNFADGVSISFWIKTTSTAWSAICGTSGGSVGSTFTRINLQVNSNGNASAGRIFFQIADKSNNSLSAYTTNTTGFNDGDWHHIVVTADPGNDTIVIYVDNSSQGLTYTAQGTPTTFVNLAADMWIAAYNVSGGLLYLTADLDELGFWNKILSSTEVSELYNSGDGLAYPFSSGTTINATAQALTATLNSPTVSIDATISVSTLSLSTTRGTPDPLIVKIQTALELSGDLKQIETIVKKSPTTQALSTTAESPQNLIVDVTTLKISSIINLGKPIFSVRGNYKAASRNYPIPYIRRRY